MVESVTVTQGNSILIEDLPFEFAGSTLDIQIQQGAGQELDFVTLDNSQSPPTFLIDATSEETLGTHQLYITSVHKSTIVWQDIITIEIEESE